MHLFRSNLWDIEIRQPKTSLPFPSSRILPRLDISRAPDGCTPTGAGANNIGDAGVEVELDEWTGAKVGNRKSLEIAFFFKLDRVN